MRRREFITPAQWRGGGLAARGRRAAAGDASDRLSQRPLADQWLYAGRIALGTLDSAEIGPVESAFMRQRLLTKLLRGADKAHVLRKNVPQGACPVFP
jgi:hypothetical protein